MKSKKSRIIFVHIFFLLSTLLSGITHTVNLDGSADFTSIQAAIEMSDIGDTVLVSPGRYYENINFLGKDITVTSRYMENYDESFINNTIIDGNQNGSVVVFENHETNEAILSGFTITNGSGYDYDGDDDFTFGGGIYISWASPTLVDLVIENNSCKGTGGGILISSSSASLSGVTIRNNFSNGVGGGLEITKMVGTSAFESEVNFDPVNRCSIYNNYAGFQNDISIPSLIQTTQFIYLDKFTIENPGLDYISLEQNLVLEAEHFWLESYQEEADLYVAPDGDDSNSGLDWDAPLKTINWAMQKIVSDSLNHRNIYLAPGVYSTELNDQFFPINMKAYVNLVGSGSDNTEFVINQTRAQCIYAWEDKIIRLKGVKIRSVGEPSQYGNYVIYTNLCDAIIEDVIIQDFISDSDMINIYGSLLAKDVQVVNCRGFIAIDSGYVNTTLSLDNIKVIGFRGYGGVGGLALKLSSNDYCQVTNSMIIDTYNFDNMWPMSNINMLNTDRLEFHNNIVANNASNGSLIRIGDGTTANISNSIFINNSNPSMFLFSREGEDNYVNISNCICPGGENPTYAWVAHPDNADTFLTVGEGMIDAATVSMDSIFVGGDENDPLSYYPRYNEITIDRGNSNIEDFTFPEFDALGNERIWDGDEDGEAVVDLGCYEYQPYPTPFNLEADESTGTIFWETIPQQELESFGIYLDDEYYCTYHQYDNHFCFPNLNEGVIYTAGVTAQYANGESEIVETTFTYLPLDTEDDIESVPVLLKNYPNPFSLSNSRTGVATTIEFTIPQGMHSERNGEIAIYNIRGQVVRKLNLKPEHFNEIRSRINWDGRDMFGYNTASGVYLYYLKIGDRIIKSNKMLLIK